MNKKILTSIALFAVGMSLFGLLFYKTELTVDVVVQTFSDINWFLLWLCPILTACFFLFSSLKWQAVTHAQTADRLGIFFYFRYISLSASIGQMLPLTLTNAAIRAFAMKRKDVMPPMKTAGLFIWDQGFDFLALFVFMMAGVVHFFFEANALLVTFGLIVAVILIYLSMSLLIAFIVWLAGCLAKTSFLPVSVRDRFLALQGAGIMDAGLARRLFLLALGKFLTGAVLYTLIVMSLGRTGLGEVVFWGTPSAEMAGVLSQMPGGLGAFDWTWVGIFTKNGLQPQAAASLAVGLRCLLVLTNFFVTICTLCVYFLVGKKWR